MCVNNEGAIVIAEIAFSGDFNLHHAESLSSCGFAHIDVEVSVLYIKHNKLCQSVTTAECLEFMFPIHDLVNLMCLHSVNINDMDKCGYLID